MKLSLQMYGFSEWAGGIDFIYHLAEAIIAADPENKIHKQLNLPGNDLYFFARKIGKPFKEMLKSVVRQRKISWTEWNGFDETYFRNSFRNLEKSFELYYPGTRFNKHVKHAIDLDSDIILPCIAPPAVRFKIPWIGYIPDFQHKHLPHFFTDDERHERDKAFHQMLHLANHVIVNAKSVINDANDFIGSYPAQIHTLPFSPCPRLSWIQNQQDIRPKYGINKPYFMISNQFWIHKDHITAFKAFSDYLSEGNDCLLVCTGGTFDYRHPRYFDDLQNLLAKLKIRNRVLILGHIPKDDQISLMKHATAIIQPSLFEGGPGGGAGHDAIALGIPLIASDIAVNKEIEDTSTYFFSTGDPTDLSQAMCKIAQQERKILSNDELLTRGLIKKQICGRAIFNIIDCALNKK